MAYRPQVTTVPQGGIGTTTLTSNGILYGNAAGTVQVTAQGAANTVLTANAGAPSFSSSPRITALGVGAAAGASGITFDGTNLLDAYTTNTFTPVLSFDGGSVGITYSVQSGRYWKLGVLVFIEVQVSLTSKGTSVGGAQITGLPFVSAGAGTSVTPCVSANMTLTGEYPVFVSIAAGTSSMSPVQGSAVTTISLLTNLNFNNNSELYLTGFYFSAT